MFNNKYESNIDNRTKIEKEDKKVKSIGRKGRVKEISVINSIFEVSDKVVDPTLVSVMMPFSEEFNGVYQMIGSSCKFLDLKCSRAHFCFI